MSAEIKIRSGAWYLLPIFLTIIGGVIAYNDIQNSSINTNDYFENSGIDYVTFSGKSISDESQINGIEENAVYSYNSYGLKVNFIELREVDENAAEIILETSITKIDENSMYSIVSEIQNRDDVEKTFTYHMSYESDNGLSTSVSSEEVISPHGVMVVNGGWGQMDPGTYKIKIFLDDPNFEGVIYDSESFWRLLYLEEE